MITRNNPSTQVTLGFRPRSFILESIVLPTVLREQLGTVTEDWYFSPELTFCCINVVIMLHAACILHLITTSWGITFVFQQQKIFTIDPCNYFTYYYRIIQWDKNTMWEKTELFYSKNWYLNWLLKDYNFIVGSIIATLYQFRFQIP